MYKPFYLFLLCALPVQALAESAQNKAIQPESVIASESMTKMITGLLLVLALIIAIAWLLKRFSILPTVTAGQIKVIASTNVGQRERVVIVELGETCLVLGVTSNQINKLHSMKKSSLHQALEPTPKQTDTKFTEALNHSINTSNRH